jgi:hypothetical protein
MRTGSFLRRTGRIKLCHLSYCMHIAIKIIIKQESHRRRRNIKDKNCKSADRKYDAVNMHFRA